METTKLEAMDIMNITNPQPTLATTVMSVRLKLIPKLMLTTTTLDSMETTKLEAMDIMNITNPQPTLATTVMVTTTTDPTTSTTILSTDSPSIIRVILHMENSRTPCNHHETSAT